VVSEVRLLKTRDQKWVSKITTLTIGIPPIVTRAVAVGLRINPSNVVCRGPHSTTTLQLVILLKLVNESWSNPPDAITFGWQWWDNRKTPPPPVMTIGWQWWDDRKTPTTSHHNWWTAVWDPQGEKNTKGLWDHKSLQLMATVRPQNITISWTFSNEESIPTCIRVNFGFKWYYKF
jgi:hypothetical protein